ncbi:MAG: type II toxin-antitoxin system HicB family antitoxin [Candidatus Electrothrix sp. AUS4]|nr:type II toxin-antitoxin system HicB family antitoxin [Candidatus Electrothrix sp. AUS4]
MQFNAIIERDRDGFYAYIPALQGCMSQGDTLEEALANIKEALELYLEDMEEQEKERLSESSYIIAPITVEPIAHA